jgi:hypothetical protein
MCNASVAPLRVQALCRLHARQSRGICRMQAIGWRRCSPQGHGCAHLSESPAAAAAAGAWPSAGSPLPAASTSASIASMASCSPGRGPCCSAVHAANSPPLAAASPSRTHVLLLPHITNDACCCGTAMALPSSVQVPLCCRRGVCGTAARLVHVKTIIWPSMLCTHHSSMALLLTAHPTPCPRGVRTWCRACRPHYCHTCHV